jgi:hypothetical protein
MPRNRLACLLAGLLAIGTIVASKTTSAGDAARPAPTIVVPSKINLIEAEEQLIPIAVSPATAVPAQSWLALVSSNRVLKFSAGSAWESGWRLPESELTGLKVTPRPNSRGLSILTIGLMTEGGDVLAFAHTTLAIVQPRKTGQSAPIASAPPPPPAAMSPARVSAPVATPPSAAPGPVTTDAASPLPAAAPPAAPIAPSPPPPPIESATPETPGRQVEPQQPSTKTDAERRPGETQSAAAASALAARRLFSRGEE